MVKRILVAIPIVIIVALAVFIQGWVLAVFAAGLALMCQFEVVRALDKNGRPLIKGVSFIYAAVLAVLFLVRFGMSLTMDTSHIILVFVLAVIAAFVVQIFSSEHSMEKVWNTVFTLVYPQLFFVCFYIMILDNMQVQADAYYAMMAMLLMVFLPAMFTDTFAYFFGKAFGKRKLCPEISPKKTIAGSVAGIAGGMLAAVLVWFAFERLINIPIQPFVWFLATGAALAVVAQFGDLSASLIKRSLGIKDFGRLLPGHGGVVDRMDSIIFCIPVLYLFYNILFW